MLGKENFFTENIKDNSASNQSHLVVRSVEGVGCCPLPGAKVPVGVDVLGTGRSCVAPGRQGQGRGGRAG